MGDEMFIKRLNELLKENGLTRRQFLEDLGMGVNQIKNWEKGRQPNPSTLAVIADYFGVSVNYLLGNSDDRIDPEENGDLIASIPQRYLDAANGNVKKALELMDADEKDAAKEAAIMWKMREISKKRPPVGNLDVVDPKFVRMVPLFESVSAGFGAYAADAIVGYVPTFIQTDGEADDALAIRVSGDSMYPKIEDGDIVIVHKQDSVDSNAIAVVLLDGDEGLVKRVEYGPDWIHLHSINPMYPVMKFKGEEVLRIRIVGKVSQIIKNVG